MITINANLREPIFLRHAGEENALRVAFDLQEFEAHWPGGVPALLVRRPISSMDAAAYPVPLSVDGRTAFWTVSASDTECSGYGKAQLQWRVGGTLAKSCVYDTVCAPSLLAGDAPPDAPSKAWFEAIQGQIGDLSKLTTKEKENLVAAINEAARTGGGSGGEPVSLGITGAQVGQIAKITAVDTQGKPTKWEPVDMAGGGGSPVVSSDWALLADITLAEDSAIIKIDKTSAGDSFSIRELAIFGEVKCDTVNKTLTLSLNGKIGYGNPTLSLGGVLNAAETEAERLASYIEVLPECVFCRTQHNPYNTIMDYNTPFFGASSLRNDSVIAFQGIGNPLTVFAIAPWSNGKSGVFKAGTSLKFYGRE